MSDPVLERRARLGALAGWGQRIGYLLLLLAIAGFVAGLFTGFDGWAGTVVIASLGATCITLAPAIVLGYAVRAAQREDDERKQARQDG